MKNRFKRMLNRPLEPGEMAPDIGNKKKDEQAMTPGYPNMIQEAIAGNGPAAGEICPVEKMRYPEFDIEIEREGTSKLGAIYVDIKFMDGKRYRLQWPGNRAKEQINATLTKIKGNEINIDFSKWMAAALDACVFPLDGQPKPNVDNLDNLPYEYEAWKTLLRRFVDRGQLDPEH